MQDRGSEYMIRKFSNQSEIERKKHEDNIKYLYFSRYLMVRYTVVFFLFSNLVWLLILIKYQKILGIILSAIMTVLSGIAAIEQLTKMHNRKNDVPFTRTYLWIQIIINILLFMCVFIPLKIHFLPFVTDVNTKYLILTILLIDLVIAYSSERRIHNIRSGKYRYLKVIKSAKNN